VAIAARYFSSLRYVKRLHVVEAESVPHYILNGVYLFDGLGARVPLGERILEGPDDATRFARRDERISYTAYVPVGSIARGRTMVQRAGAGQVPCASCHGTGLKGGIAPPLAGRSPTVTFRQLYAFQNDLRNGEDAATMKAMVAGLPLQRLIDLSAYCASLAP
jgi:cytochrome c553